MPNARISCLRVMERLSLVCKNIYNVELVGCPGEANRLGHAIANFVSESSLHLLFDVPFYKFNILVQYYHAT